MIDPEVHAIGTRAGVRWIVVHAGRANIFDTEDDARDFAQVLIARAASVAVSRPTED